VECGNASCRYSSPEPQLAPRLHMKRRVGFLGWIVGAVVLVSAVYAGVTILNFAWWGPGYAGALAPKRLRTVSRVAVYDRVIVVERNRVLFRRSPWASARRAMLLGAAAAIVALAVLRRRSRLPLLAGVVVAIATFAIVHSRAREVVVPRGVPRQLLLRTFDDEYAVVDARSGRVLVRLPGNDEREARLWRDVIAEKIASRP